MPKKGKRVMIKKYKNICPFPSKMNYDMCRTVSTLDFITIINDFAGKFKMNESNNYHY